MEHQPLSHVNIDDIVDKLCCLDKMQHVCPERRHEGQPVLSNQSVERIVELTSGLLFPGFFNDSIESQSVLRSMLMLACHELRNLLIHQITAGLCFADTSCSTPMRDINSRATEASDAFIALLPDLRRMLDTDIDATYLGDPAATSTHEVLVCYPGLRATISYRIAHALLQLKVPILPRMISELAHSATGIDIHPGATIGERFVIDHGTGVVIGETAIIGNNVKLYQGVTLGARSFVTDDSNNPVKGGIPRHPIIGDNVVIYSNTTVLGRITVGDGAVIGGNLWVSRDVAPGEKLVQARADNFRSSIN